MRAVRGIAVLLTWAGSTAWAIPPLVSGDVPTADDGTYELFLGYLLTEAGSPREHEVPFFELVYGVTPWQEVTVEIPLRLHEGVNGSTGGVGDLVLGAKRRLLGRPAADAGLSVSLEVSFPTGDEDRGLGSGTAAADLRARGGFEISGQVLYFNLGRTWVDSRGSDEENTWFASAVWDRPLGGRWRFLTELYGKTAGDPDTPDRLALTLGTKWRLPRHQQFQASVGRSVRSGADGGPALRIYIGWRRDFARRRASEGRAVLAR